MAEDINSFTAGVIQWTDEETREALGKLHRAVTLGMLRDVAIETPVDTGRARGNWQVGRDTIPGSELDDTDPSPQAAGVVARENATVAQIKPFSISYVANNVPYIGALNDGHSKQAPAGFVDRVFNRYRRAVGSR